MQLVCRQIGISWCFSDRSSWIDSILITNLVHWLLFIHKIIFSSTCFEPQVLIFRRIQLYTCSIWYCHSLWDFLVACRYTAWVRTHCHLFAYLAPCFFARHYKVGAFVTAGRIVQGRRILPHLFRAPKARACHGNLTQWMCGPADSLTQYHMEVK